MITIEKFVKKVVTAAPTESLATIAGLMGKHNVGSVVIVEGLRPVGIVTDRDLALAVVGRGISPQVTAATIMSTQLRVVGRDDGVFDTTRAMNESGVRRLPVVDPGGRLVGLVTLDDLLRLLARELSNLADGIKFEMDVK